MNALALKALIPNWSRQTWITIALVTVVIIFIYSYGRRKGKEDAFNCSWWEKLFGCAPSGGTFVDDKLKDEIRDNYGNWDPMPVTLKLRDAMYNELIDFGGGLSEAWAAFNSLATGQKLLVVDAWNRDIAGTKGGLFSKFSTIGQELRETLKSGFEWGSTALEMNKAKEWMDLNNIQ